MEPNCPDCGIALRADTGDCGCGWKKNTATLPASTPAVCNWTRFGLECQMPPGTNSGFNEYFCLWHRFYGDRRETATSRKDFDHFIEKMNSMDGSPWKGDREILWKMVRGKATGEEVRSR